MAAQTDSISVQRTLPESVGVQVHRTEFDGPVTLSAEDLPVGVTATFDPAVLAAGETDSQLTLSASPAAPLGVATVTVRATADGVDDSEDAFRLAVIVRGAFSIEPLPDSILVYQEESGTVKLAVLKTGGFAGTIEYSVIEALPGIAVTVDAASLVDTALVTISPDDTAPVSTRTLQMNATTEGLEPRHVALRVTVQQRPAISLLMPDSVAVETGHFDSWGVFLHRTNYPGDVEFTAEDVPAGAVDASARAEDAPCHVQTELLFVTTLLW